MDLASRCSPLSPASYEASLPNLVYTCGRRPLQAMAGPAPLVNLAITRLDLRTPNEARGNTGKLGQVWRGT